MESTEYKISEDDQKFIDLGTTDEEKKTRKEIITNSMDVNGAVDIAQPGMAVSYINRENYSRIVAIDSMAGHTSQILENALNWDCLGRGKGGLAGAAVRCRLRELVDKDRECIVITKFDAKWIPLMKEYAEYSANNKHFYATWFANAWNVLGLATSCFIRECHHWNAQNLRPIKALCGSLNMDAELPEGEYRKAFYLAIHPIPLKYLTAAYVKGKDPLDRDISETVRQRLNVPPAGYADFCATGVAAQAFLSEKFAGYSTLVNEIKDVYYETVRLRNNPLCYNQFASQLGVKKMEFNKAKYTEAMIVLAAYAKSQIGGTLAKSPALGKFIEAHQRKVNRFIDAFDRYAQSKSDDLLAMISGKTVSDLDDLPGKLKPLVKVQSSIEDLKNPEVAKKITKLIADRVDQVLKETEDFKPNAQSLPDTTVDDFPFAVTDDQLRNYLNLLADRSRRTATDKPGETPASATGPKDPPV